MSFANLKRNRNSLTDRLNKEVTKINGGGSTKKNYKDDRYWNVQPDKAGNAYAVIRFLPAPNGEELPWSRLFTHGFQGPSGKWYIENSLTTLGDKDPVAEYNSKLWNSGIEANKEIARKQKRRLNYVSNILVVKDSANPENEGKVFLYRYGKKIWDKINNAMNPEFEDETPINPFDLWEGAMFKLKVRKQDGYRNYDKSEFSAQCPAINAHDDGLDEALEELWGKEHSLADLIAPKEFKSYAELEEKLQKVLGLVEEATPSTPAPAASKVASLNPAKRPAPKMAEEEETDFLAEAEASVASKPTPAAVSSDDDADMDYFAALVE